MNTNRIIDNEPLENIHDDSDLLFTNTFVNSISHQDISFNQKENFKRYYEDKKKNAENKKIIELVDEQDIYDDFSKFVNKTVEKTNVIRNTVQKNKQNTIKTEKISTISVDSSNRDFYKYPSQNHFKLDFRKTFYNVKSIKLISSSIPNTDRVIRDTPEEIRTDKISWQNLDDQYIGIYTNCVASTTVSETVDITVPDHGLSTQEYVDPLTIILSNSTTVPSIDGEWSVTIIDSNTLRIPFGGGLTVSGTSQVDVGFPTYTVYLTPGNYSLTTLSVEMQRKMNLVKRSKGTGDYHYFTIDIDNDTDVITVRSYITKVLEIDPISTEEGTGDVTVYSEQHGFKDGDFVLITDISSTGGISSTLLNGLFIVKEATRSSFKYEVNLPSTFSENGGGNAGKTGKPSEFRFIFDMAQSKIVNHLGFPDEDSGVYLNTSVEDTLSVYTKSGTYVELIDTQTIEFTSISHGLEQCETIIMNSITTGYGPTVTLSSNHGLQGKSNVFIYYPTSTPDLYGFYDITINGPDTFILDNVTINSTAVGVNLGDVKINGDKIRLLNFKSIPTITEIEFPVESTTDDTFRIKVYNGIQSIQQDSITNTIIQTNKIYVNHPLHRFNELTSINILPFLQATWDISNTTTDGRTMYSITRGSGKFVSVGRFGSSPPYYNIKTSVDGYSWGFSFDYNRNIQGQLNSVCYAPSVSALSNTPLYVAVGEDNPSNNLVLISSTADIDLGLPNPSNWTVVNISFGGIWESVCWSVELQLFVACGFVSDNNRIMSSPDGTNWTLRPDPSTIYPDFSYKSISWSPELGIFVIVGDGETLFSSDGISWTPSTSYIEDYWESVTWSPELGLFVAVADKLFGTIDNKYAMTSSDGDIWVSQFTPIGSYFRSVAWAPALGIFLAVGSGDTELDVNADSMMTSRNGITWVERSFTPSRYMREVCWASDLNIFVCTAVDPVASPDEYNFLISNISYTDLQCNTLVPHSYTGTRYNDQDLPVYETIVDNADIDIEGHGLQTNDKIIITDSTTTPDINGSYFIEVVDPDIIRIPVTLVSGGTCKVRTGDSVIFSGTDSIPSIDGIQATVIGFDPNDPTYLELDIGINVTTPGTAGIIGRRNIISLHRVESSRPFSNNFAGIPLELINNSYHKIDKIIDENTYTIKTKEFALYSYSGGGNDITISSEKHGSRVFQSNTFTFEEEGSLFRAIELSGEPYIFLVSPNLGTIFSPGHEELGDIFAKILLVGSPGDIIFDSYISTPKVFNPPLSYLNDIQLDVKRRDGYLFNFNNTDYSISLEITEIVDQIEQTGLSGRTGTSDLYDKAFTTVN